LHQNRNIERRISRNTTTNKMPAIRHASKRKAPPSGFSDIEDSLLIFANKMKDAENAGTTNVPRHQTSWAIFQISHQRSRYVYELYYGRPKSKAERLAQKQKRLDAEGEAAQGEEEEYVEEEYEEGKISKELYDWLLKNGYADAMLIAKWKKNGYEKLCCLRCIQTKETNFNSTCICRVPKHTLKEDQNIECVSCGCRGCASSD